MGRRDDDEPPKPTEEADAEMDEEAIRAKLLREGWDKKRLLKSKAEDKDKDKDKGKDKEDKEERRERKSSRGSRSRRSRSRSRRRDRDRDRDTDRDRDRDRERRSGRSSRHKPSSRHRSRSVSKSRSRSAPRSSSKRHSSSKRRASRSKSRSASRVKEPSAKRSRRASRSPSGSSSPRKSKKRDGSMDKKEEQPEKKEEEKVEKTPDATADVSSEKEKTSKDSGETGPESEGGDKHEDKENGKTQDKKTDKEGSGSPTASHKKSRRSSRRSRSKSRSPSRSSRRRRHRSRSRSNSRSRRSRRSSRSRSRSRSRRDRDRRRRDRSVSRSRSRSRSSHRHRRSSSRDRKRRDSHSSAATPDQPGGAAAASAPVPEAPVNPTITQLMQQYPTLSLQEIIAKMQAVNVTMAAAAASKPSRELYVGNLPPNVTGPQLQEFLGTIIQQVGLTAQPGNPIVNTWLSSDGHFAFCEMRSVEECTLALLLNQLSLLGQPLKFGRPKSYVGPPQPFPPVSARTQTALVNLGCTPNPMWFTMSAGNGDLGVPAVPSAIPPSISSVAPASIGLSSTPAPAPSLSAPPTGNKLVMMNIPIVLNEDQLKELVEPFGKLQSFALLKDTSTGVPTASAVFEYEDASVTDQAAEGLNGLDIGGIPLSVRRESATTTVVSPNEQPSPVVKMANMVSADELKDDDEFADLAEDVEEECKRFGTISRLEIPRPKDGEDVPGVGNIFVRFKDEAEAAAAIKALSGRKFGGNIVHVSYYSVAKFEKGEFA